MTFSRRVRRAAGRSSVGAVNTLLRDGWLPVALAVAAGVETALVSDSDVVLRTTFAVLTVLGLVARRRQPALTAAWIAVGMSLESALTESPDEIGVLVAYIVSAFAVGGAGDRKDTVLGCAMLGLAVTVSIALDPSDSVANVPGTLLLFLAVPAGLGWLFDRRGRALVTLAEANVDLRREAAEAIDAERRRLSHELHDVVSHAVTLIAVTAEAGATAVRSDPEGAERRFAAIAETSRDALAELRALLALLDAPESSSPPGLSTLDALVAGVRSAGASVDVEVDLDVAELPPEIDRAAFRVVQEALTNALRHSRDPRLTLEIVGGASGLDLRVVSRGASHRSSYGGSQRGLAGLSERVAELGGAFEAGRGDDGAFVVTARFPVAVR